MMQIITKTPLYVWPLFFYLVYIGLKARKTTLVPWKVLFIMPSVFITWSFYTILTRYTVSFPTLFSWLLCLAIGSIIGYVITNQQKLNCHKKTGRIELSGSYLTLIFSMSIFTLKYGINMSAALHPEWLGTLILFIPELLATIISGIFLGRALRCFRLYHQADERFKKN